MSEDIVARLNDAARIAEIGDCFHEDILREAAAEIERLRADVARECALKEEFITEWNIAETDWANLTVEASKLRDD